MTDQKPTIVVIGFKTTYEFNRDTGKNDRPVDWVTYAPAHMAMYTQVEERVEWMKPKEDMRDQRGIKTAFLNHRWSMIERAYEAWKKGHEIPLDGTALAAWPGINAAQAQALRAAGVLTVEQVATMPDSMIQRVQLPSVRELRKQAQAYLDNTDRSRGAAKVAEQDAKIEALQEQLAAAMELLEQRAEEERPKRGRPPKAETQAAA